MLALGDVLSGSIKADGFVIRVAIRSPGRMNPSHVTSGGDSPVLDVIDLTSVNAGRDRLPGSLAVVWMQKRIEQIEVHLGVGGQPEMYLAALVPDDFAEGHGTVKGAEWRGVHGELQLLLQLPGALLRIVYGLDLIADLILPFASAQCGLHGAHHRPDRCRALEQGDVGQRIQNSRRSRQTIGAAHQYDQWKLRPRRLLAQCREQLVSACSAKRLLG